MLTLQLLVKRSIELTFFLTEHLHTIPKSKLVISLLTEWFYFQVSGDTIIIY